MVSIFEWRTSAAKIAALSFPETIALIYSNKVCSSLDELVAADAQPVRGSLSAVKTALFIDTVAQ